MISTIVFYSNYFIILTTVGITTYQIGILVF